MANARLYPFWANLTDALRTGEPQNEIKTGDPSMFDTLYADPAFGLMMSLNMLIETPGGFDYTGSDCQGWMREVGFSATRVEPLVGPDSMVVGIK